MFSASPLDLVSGFEGVKILENGLQDIEGYVNTLSDKEKWDALVALQAEVVHIDPRDKGGYIITVGDLDIMSTAGTVDLYISASEDSKVKFGTGSTLMVVGSPYISRDGEGRISTTGWWCAEAMQGVEAVAELDDVEGWD